MSSINKNELSQFSNAAIMVNQNGEESKSVGGVISSFRVRTEDGSLKGQIWQQEGAKLTQYMTALNKGASIASKISNAITNAIHDLMDVWDSRFGDEVNDAYRDDIQEELNKAQSNLDSLCAQASMFKDGSATKISLSYSISAAQTAVNELKDLLAAIDTFIAEYNRVSSELDNLMEELESGFGSYVKSITATASWNFTPY